jgi:hypothetical protein
MIRFGICVNDFLLIYNLNGTQLVSISILYLKPMQPPFGVSAAHKAP